MESIVKCSTCNSVIIEENSIRQPKSIPVKVIGTIPLLCADCYDIQKSSFVPQNSPVDVNPLENLTFNKVTPHRQSIPSNVCSGVVRFGTIKRPVTPLSMKRSFSENRLYTRPRSFHQDLIQYHVEKAFGLGNNDIFGVGRGEFYNSRPIRLDPISSPRWF
jgi:hypothetical protein